MFKTRSISMNIIRTITFIITVFATIFCQAAVNLHHKYNNNDIVLSMFSGDESLIQVVKVNNGFKVNKLKTSDNELIFDFLLPWQPTHFDVFSDGHTIVVGSLEKNSHRGASKEVYFINSGAVTAKIDDVFSFRMTRNKKFIHVLKYLNDSETSTFEIYNEEGILLKSKKLNTPATYDHGFFSIANDLSSYTTSYNSRDIGSSQEQHIYYGNNFENQRVLQFGRKNIYQANVIDKDTVILNVEGKLYNVKGNKNQWIYKLKNNFIDSINISKDNKYILITAESTDSFAVLKMNGDVIIEQIMTRNKNDGLLEFLGPYKDDIFEKKYRKYYFMDDDLVIVDKDVNLVHILSLKNKKHKGSFNIDANEKLISNSRKGIKKLMLKNNKGALRFIKLPQ
jgi:hypothetical protein